ncbi:MAG: zf-HC2 domain-containing protein [Deltaproteobacteria bacterium]|nr:zf-HC2 domain-containing protein [Deltaproteobacteria bacterium]MBI2209910.1 zf-HC2 domain-containing protein [Deltaproteobacteria bacterium]MBI2990685.1 zf-HC2 domain-containing protein [Deltaproteobacteria bacterium]
MNCQDVRELSSDYLDRRLAPHELSALEEHLGVCPDCRREIEALRATISLLGSLDPVETSADFLSRVHRKLEKESRLSRIRGWLLEPIKLKVPLEITALVLVGILVSHLYYRSPELAKESRLSVPPESPQAAGDSTAERSREAGGREVHERDRAEPKRRSEAAEPAAAAEKSLDAVSRAAAEEVVADDVASYEKKVQALLAQMGGRILGQEGAADSVLLLTVELPQSRQAEFLASLKEGRAAEVQAPKSKPQALQGLKKEAEDKRDPPATGRIAESRAPSALEQSPRKDQPMVRLQLRILPKK